MVTGVAMQRRDFATRWPRWARWADRTSSVALPLMMFVAAVLATGR
jgi:hypothetical protein